MGLTAYSQETGNYRGRITAGNNPHGGATIALFKKSNSALVKLSVSDNEDYLNFRKS